MSGPVASPPPAAISSRMERPLAITAVVGAPTGVGVDVSYQVHDRVALSAQVSTLGIITSAGGNVRLFPLASERAGLYVGAGASAFYASFMGSSNAGVFVNGEVGGEFRAHNGFTIAGGVGGLYVPTAGKAVPEAQLRLGYAW